MYTYTLPGKRRYHEHTYIFEKLKPILHEICAIRSSNFPIERRFYPARRRAKTHPYGVHRSAWYNPVRADGATSRGGGGSAVGVAQRGFNRYIAVMRVDG